MVGPSWGSRSLRRPGECADNVPLTSNLFSIYEPDTLFRLSGTLCTDFVVSHLQVAHIAQSVEHILGKDEVTGSIPVVSSLG